MRKKRNLKFLFLLTRELIKNLKEKHSFVLRLNLENIDKNNNNDFLNFHRSY